MNFAEEAPSAAADSECMPALPLAARRRLTRCVPQRRLQGLRGKPALERHLARPQGLHEERRQRRQGRHLQGQERPSEGALLFCLLERVVGV
jgi:hypothetical protein